VLQYYHHKEHKGVTLKSLVAVEKFENGIIQAGKGKEKVKTVKVSTLFLNIKNFNFYTCFYWFSHDRETSRILGFLF
jgi:hypothetical protein